MLPKQESEQFYQVALSFVPEVGPKTARSLLAKYGTASGIFNTPVKELKSLIGETKARGFTDETIYADSSKELAFAEKHGVQLLFINSEDYPRRFLHCDDAPILLYYKGSADLNAEKVVAIVGTRKNTDYGQRACEALIEGLQGQEGLIVTSGLALGIDTIAHRTSLRCNLPTVGAVGHGLDIIYPLSNRALAADMEQHGGIISEFPSGTGPERQNFPVRNRVVAGMSDITVIVESDIKGGAMITAFIANSYNREVAAFPGRVFDTKSGGPNHLIKKNIAAMITGADDLLELMNWGKHKDKRAVQKQLFMALSPEEELLLEQLKEKDSVHTDDLLLGSGFTSPQLAAVLLQLEMKGMIKSLPGKLYRLN